MFKFRSVRSSRSARQTSRKTALQARACSYQASLEALEQRAVLSAVSWINPAGGAWDVGSNWSTGSVPTSADDVTIDTASAITISIQSNDNISVNSVTTGANDTLSFGGGSLTVSVASTLDGPLTMTGGALAASGAGASLTAHSDTTISSANLNANSGGTLSLPKLTSYTTSVSAIGTGSLVDLSSFD